METLKYKKGNAMVGMVVQRFQEFAEQVIGNVNWFEENGGHWGNDGWFGKDSDTAAKIVQKKLGLEADGIVGQKTWKAMFEFLGRGKNGALKYDHMGVKVIDGRDIWTPVKKYDGVQRTWTKSGNRNISGVMLHQTACMMPEDPLVWNKINAHVGITRKGVIILMFPFEMLIWHGNGLTGPTIGIEIAGLFKGVEDSTNTWWPPGAKTHDFNDAQLKACGALFDIIKTEFDEKGGKWKHVYAHRQSSDMRMSDPGEMVWKKVGMPWIDKLGATEGGDKYKIYSGYSIPKEWNPAYTNGFWRK